jgi:hypothetical protein
MLLPGAEHGVELTHGWPSHLGLAGDPQRVTAFTAAMTLHASA